MNRIKTKRIGATFVKEISKIIRNDIKDPHIQFVTVTGCDVTNDLSFAKVYCTILKTEFKDVTLESLNNASTFIEMELSKHVSVRKMPKISFHYDNSIEYGKNIEAKLKELKDKE